MAAHYVTCVYCKERFNRDKLPFVAISARRYAHKECAEKHNAEQSQEEIDLKKLEQYVMQLFNEPYVNQRVKKQIQDFKKEYNYTYSGILKTLIYWYEVKGNSIEKSNGGIGIVPYVYKDAYNYFYNLFLAKMINQEKDIKDYKPTVTEIRIKPPRVETKQIRLFKFEED